MNKESRRGFLSRLNLPMVVNRSIDISSEPAESGNKALSKKFTRRNFNEIGLAVSALFTFKWLIGRIDHANAQGPKSIVDGSSPDEGPDPQEDENPIWEGKRLIDLRNITKPETNGVTDMYGVYDTPSGPVFYIDGRVHSVNLIEGVWYLDLELEDSTIVRTVMGLDEIGELSVNFTETTVEGNRTIGRLDDESFRITREVADFYAKNLGMPTTIEIYPEDINLFLNADCDGLCGEYVEMNNTLIPKAINGEIDPLTTKLPFLNHFVTKNN